MYLYPSPNVESERGQSQRNGSRLTVNEICTSAYAVVHYEFIR
jgi:hypothetical protein